MLLTAYNREDYIAESIESVLAQTCADFELIIADDQSQDGTADIVQRYASRDPRIRFSVNATNLGQFRNRRHVASLATGRFLKYHDSDDVMYRHCLAAMVEPLDAEPRAAFALSAAGYWPGGQCPMLLTPELAYEREFLGSGLFNLGPAAAMFRSEALHDLGGFSEAGVASDYLFWLKACTVANVLLVPGDLFHYRLHDGQELTSPAADREYAQTSTVTWNMLNSPACPLRGDALEQAKRNFTYTLVRKWFRQSRRRQFASALMTLRYSGMGPLEWLRYLRPPRRSAYAGSPPANGGGA